MLDRVFQLKSINIKQNLSRAPAFEHNIPLTFVLPANREMVLNPDKITNLSVFLLDLKGM